MSATVGDELVRAVASLREAGVQTPQLDAQLLMARAVGTSRLDVLAHPERVLADNEATALEEMIDKRASRYPLAYILGEKEFFGLGFIVSPSVLIPRPETEVLVEQVLRRVDRNAAVADVGTGTGAIAVALAVNLPDARIWAVDSSEQALKVARANAEKHGVSERVCTLQGDLLEPLVERGLRFDAVVSNPPYIPREVIPTLDPEVRFEPVEALDGGTDGLDAYRRLFPQAASVTGLAVVEFGAGQGAAVAETARAAGFVNVEIVPDLAGIERVAAASK